MNAILVPLFAFMDRAVGGIKGGRAMSIALMVASFFFLGFHVAALMLLWGVYRLGVGFFGGSAAPRKDQYKNAFLRHLIAVPAFVGVAAFFSLSIPVALAAGMAYALAATSLAIYYGKVRDVREWQGRDIGNVNTYIEVIRGAAFGAASAGMFAYG